MKLTRAQQKQRGDGKAGKSYRARPRRRPLNVRRLMLERIQTHD